MRPGPELNLPVPLQTRLNLTFQKQDGKPAAGIPVTLVLMVPASRQSWPCPLNDGKPFVLGSDGRLSLPAVPAAMRLAIPEANPGVYVTMSLAITFPFNITLGLPLYLGVINRIWN